jgi:hypothetical protein
MKSKTAWDVFGAFLFLFCGAVMLRSQGQQIPPIPFVGTVEPEIVTVFGILISTPTLILLLRFADRYRRRNAHGPIERRLPPVFSDADGPGPRFLGWLAFLVGPALAQIHFLREFLQHGYFQRFTGEHIPGGAKSVLTAYRPLSVLFTDDYRYHHPHGVTVFPFWQPWLYVILVGWALVYFVIYLIRMRRRAVIDEDGGLMP